MQADAEANLSAVAGGALADVVDDLFQLFRRLPVGFRVTEVAVVPGRG